MVSIEKEVSMVYKYVPKVGDKVRATLGESVAVGGVSGAFSDAGVDTVIVEHTTSISDGSHTVCVVGEGWHFEQLVSVPTKFGAVIRRADGMLFQRTTAGNRHHDWLPNDNAFSVDEAEATAGGFTVLFDGVDE